MGVKVMANKDLVLTHDWKFVDALAAMAEKSGLDGALELQQWTERWEDESRTVFTGPEWCLTYLHGGEPVATFGGYAGPQRVVALLLWVREDWRMQGVGESLIREFVAWSMETYPNRRIFAQDCNPQSRRAFEKMGFRPVDEAASDPNYVNMQWTPGQVHLT